VLDPSSALDTAAVPPSRGRRAARAALVCAVVAAVLAAAVHLPVVRSRVLRAALAWTTQRFGLLARASTLDYNLLTLDFTLRDVSVAARHAPDRPFFAADRVEVDLPWSWTVGTRRLQTLRIDRPRVSLSTDASDRVNLPVVAGSPAGGPSAVVVDELWVRDIALTVEDRVRHVGLQVQRASLRLAGARDGSYTGRVRMSAPGALQIDGWQTTLTRLSADVGLRDGVLRLEPLSIGTSDGELALRGTAGLSADAPIDLAVGAQLHIARLAHALSSGLSASGTLQVSGRATGTLAEPKARLQVRAPALAWGGLAPATLAGSLAVSRHGALIESLRLEAPWAHATLSGSLADADANTASRLAITWSGMDAESAATAAGADLPLRLAAMLQGTASLGWRAGTTDPATIAIVATATPGRGAGLAVGGTVRAARSGANWDIAHDLTGPGGLRAAGHLTIAGAAGPSPLGGSTSASAGDLSLALGALVRAGVDVPREVVDAIGGRATAQVQYGGTTRAPRLGLNVSSDRIVYAPFAPARVDARVSVTPGRLTIESAAARLDAGTLNARALTIAIATGALAGTVDADVRDLRPLASAVLPAAGPILGAGRIAGRLGGSLSSPRLDATFETTDLTAAGQHLDSARGAIDVSTSRIAWHHLDATQASGVLQSDGWIDFRRERFEVTLVGRDLSVAECPQADPTCRGGIPLSATIATVSIAANGTLDRPTGAMDTEIRDLRWKGLDAGAASAHVRLEDGKGTLRGALPSYGASLSGTIEVPSPSRFALDVSATDASMPRLFTILGDAPLADRIAGSLSGSVHVSGDLEHPNDMTIEGTLPASSLVVDGRAWRTSRPVRLHYAPDRISVDGLALEIAASKIEVSGALSNSGADVVSLSVEGSLADLAAWLPADLDVTGRLAGQFTVTGTPRAPLVTGSATVTSATVQHAKATAVIDRLAARLGGGLVEVTDATIASGGAHAVVNGRVPVTLFEDLLPSAVLRALGTPPAGAHATLEADVAMTLADAGLLPNPTYPIGGSIAGHVELDATALSFDALRGSGTLTEAELSVGTSRIAQASPGRLLVANRRVTLEPWRLTGAGTDMTAAGSVVLRDDAVFPLAATIRGPLLLEPLQAVFGFPVSGILSADLSVSGTVTEPRAEGTIVLKSGGLRVRSPRIALADVQGSARLTGTAIEVEKVTGVVNGAPFTLSGAASLPGAPPSDASRVMRLQAQRVPVQPFATGPRAEANLDITYTEQNGQRVVAGRASLLPQPFHGSILALKQFVDAIGSANAPLGESPRRRRPGTSPVRLDVAIVSREPLLLDTNAGRVELAADLRLAGSGDQPSLLGKVTVLEDGVLRAGGRTYTISNGVIEFTNPRRIAPIINLTATTKISTYNITMVLAGTADELRTSLSSDPPLAEADLRSLIVTGRLTSPTATGQRNSVAERQVVESISGDVLGFAAHTIGLDAVSIGNPDLDLLSGDIDARTSLNLTKSISRQVDVVFSQDLQEDRTAWLFIYRPKRGLSFQLVSQDNREGSIEFRQEFVFGGKAPPSGASKPTGRKRPAITSITFTGERGFPDADLAKVLRLDAGSRFDTWKWRGETERLARFYRERGYYTARIVPRRQRAGTGVTLEYAITRGPRTTLAIDGHQMPDEVLEAMRDAWTESVSTAFLIEDLERIAKTHLIDNGYLQPEVKAEIPVNTAEAMAVLVHVRAGPQARQRHIDVTGTSEAMGKAIEQFLDDSALERSAWYDPAALKVPLQAFYRDRGYLDAKVFPGTVRLEGDRARLPVKVEEGRLYRVAAITVEGADVLGVERVRQGTGVAVQSAWQAAFLKKARLGVEATYHGAGFADTEVYVEPQIDAVAGSVTLYVAVAEGQRRMLRDLSIAGMVQTSKKTISDLALLRFGEPVTPALISDLQKRLYDAGAFSRVTVDFTPAPPGNYASTPYDEPVVANVTVQEARRYTVHYGLQVSRTLDATGTESEYKPGAAVDFRDRNFLGRAMSLGLGARVDARYRSARATLALPRTYGTSIRSYLFLDRSTETQAPQVGYSTEDDTQSVTAEQRWRARRGWELSWSLAYDFRRVSLEAATNGTTERLGLAGDTLGPRVAVVWDRRDDPFDTKRGWFHSSGLDVGVSAIGSDLGYWRYLMQQYLFVPKGPFVFASAARYGTLISHGSSSPIVLDLLYKAGGSRSVRGYAEDSLSAVDFFGLPLGGRQLVVFNQEARFPIWWWFKGVAFVDAGNTFLDASHVSLADLKVGTGWGLRLATPFALIRFDVGYPVNDGPTHTPRYYISIGQAF